MPKEFNLLLYLFIFDFLSECLDSEFDIKKQLDWDNTFKSKNKILHLLYVLTEKGDVYPATIIDPYYFNEECFKYTK